MKRYKKILMIWICAIVVVAVSVIVALYDNANQGQDVAKEVAVETLRKVAERVVNREFDGLGMFYASGSDGGKKHTKRKAISEDGEFEVIIDSLKEAQGLFPLDVVGFKADMLNYYGKFPLEEICLEWKAEMNDRYGGAMCALFLKVNPIFLVAEDNGFLWDRACGVTRPSITSHQSGSALASRYVRHGEMGEVRKRQVWSGKRDSNSQPSAWKADALAIELFPPVCRSPLTVFTCLLQPCQLFSSGGGGRI